MLYYFPYIHTLALKIPAQLIKPVEFLSNELNKNDNYQTVRIKFFIIWIKPRPSSPIHSLSSSLTLLRTPHNYSLYSSQLYINHDAQHLMCQGHLTTDWNLLYCSETWFYELLLAHVPVYLGEKGANSLLGNEQLNQLLHQKTSHASLSHASILINTPSQFFFSWYRPINFAYP